jgi:hypothetical protein
MVDVENVELAACPDVFVGTSVEEATLGILVAKGCDVGLPAVSKVVWTLFIALVRPSLFMRACSYSGSIWRAL